MWSVVTISDSAVPHYEGLCIKVGGENGISLNNLLSVFRHRVGGSPLLSWVLQILGTLKCFACFSPNQ